MKPSQSDENWAVLAFMLNKSVWLILACAHVWTCCIGFTMIPWASNFPLTCSYLRVLVLTQRPPALLHVPTLTDQVTLQIRSAVCTSARGCTAQSCPSSSTCSAEINDLLAPVKGQQLIFIVIYCNDAPHLASVHQSCKSQVLQAARVVSPPDVCCSFLVRFLRLLSAGSDPLFRRNSSLKILAA